ncbi:VENN motif pre-toxin domain-containing protein, partial [Streptococcus pyogenes]
LTADAISAMIEDDLREAFARGTLSEAEAEHMVLEWRANGVNVARLAGGLAAALAGGDVDTGADAGGNAAENNAFWIPVIAV